MSMHSIRAYGLFLFENAASFFSPKVCAAVRDHLFINLAGRTPEVNRNELARRHRAAPAKNSPRPGLTTAAGSDGIIRRRGTQTRQGSRKNWLPRGSINQASARPGRLARGMRVVPPPSEEELLGCHQNGPA